MIRVITKAPGMVNPPKVEMIEKGLTSMQKLVAAPNEETGLIELVRDPKLADHGIDMWANEEGGFNGCRLNIMAFDGQVHIRGPIFFSSSDDEGNTVGLTDEQVQIALAYLKAVPQSIF